ncbi:formyl transferase [Apiospora kogelbergensis]|uniref:formyl transferase n=1 Tax=Apiospora kogelbergensis TaxID=1337665 RepID=UPI00312FECE7
MPKKQSDPLRILFCGTDAFSCASLRALYEEKLQNPGLVESIDVVVRPGKPYGRGLKLTKHPPIRAVADELWLPVHERDTFTKWEMPPAINLIIAVSFGLLVPARLLAAAKYGGLNVHPSLLPDLRGPAPLYHALLRRLEATGVTLQTMHPHEFDKGLVLAQSRDDDLIQIPPKCTYPQLLELATPIGAQMLVQGLRDGVHVPPLEEQHRQNQGQGKSAAALYAPKILPEDRNLYRFVTSQSNEADELAKHRSTERQVHPNHIEGAGIIDSIVLAQRVIGPLWFRVMGSEEGVERTVERTRRVVLDKVDDDIVIKTMPNSRSDISVRNLKIWETHVESWQKPALAKFGNLWYIAEKRR